MWKINLNSIKNSVRLFFIINIGLVVVNYYLTDLANQAAQEERKFVDVSRSNKKILEKISYITKSIVNSREIELKKILAEEINRYNANLEALKNGGDATVDDEVIILLASTQGKRELKSLENSWAILKKQLETIIEQKIEVEIDSVESSQSAIRVPQLDSIGTNDSINIGKADSLLQETSENETQDAIETITYRFDVNPEVQKVFFLAEASLDETLSKNRELSSIYINNFTDSRTYLRSVLFITFVLNLLVLIGGTFVIGTYLINPLKRIAETAKNVATGDINTKVDYKRNDEIGEVAESLNLIVNGFKQYTEFAENIGKENFESNFEVKSNKDTLGFTLLGMRNNLKRVADEDSRRNWANEGFALFSDILRASDKDVEDFAYEIVSNLVKYINANQGGLFLLSEEKDSHFLEMKAAFAYNKRKYEDKKIAIGQGLLGQAFLEKEIIYLDEVPNEYIQISSGLGKANPRSLLITPLKVNETVFGVIEIASFNKMEQYEIDFVERLSENIASTLASVKTNENTKRLLEETRQYAEQMQAQEEEMRQNMEELAATQEEMERNQFKLEEYKRNLEKEVENRTAQLKDKEARLADALSQLQGIMDSSRASIVAIDTNFKVVAANKRAFELVRETRDATFEVGSSWIDTYKDDHDRNRIRKIWDRIFKGGLHSSDESYKLADGSRKWLETYFNPIKSDENGEVKVIGGSMFVRDITERILEQKNNQLVAHVLNNSSNEVYIFDTNDYLFKQVNERGLKNLGYSLEEIVKLTPFEIDTRFDEDSFAAFIAPLRNGLVDNLVIETTHIRKDGSKYEVEMNFQLFEDEETPLFAVIAQDITQRKQNETHLTEALERFNLAIKATKEGLWEMQINPNDPLNPDSIANWSNRFKALLGFEEDELPNVFNAWTSRLHPDDRDRVLRQFYEHLMDKTGFITYDTEYRLLTKDGEYEWFLATGETLREADGTPRKIAGSIRNINRRKKAEEELAQQTAIVNGILNAAVNSIISLNEKYEILTANPATEKIFGYENQEMKQKPLNDLLANKQEDFSIFINQTVILEAKRKDETVFPIEVSISETQNAGKKIFVAILRDISNRKDS